MAKEFTTIGITPEVKEMLDDLRSSLDVDISYTKLLKLMLLALDPEIQSALTPTRFSKAYRSQLEKVKGELA